MLLQTLDAEQFRADEIFGIPRRCRRAVAEGAAQPGCQLIIPYPVRCSTSFEQNRPAYNDAARGSRRCPTYVIDPCVRWRPGGGTAPCANAVVARPTLSRHSSFHLIHYQRELP